MRNKSMRPGKSTDPHQVQLMIFYEKNKWYWPWGDRTPSSWFSGGHQFCSLRVLVETHRFHQKTQVAFKRCARSCWSFWRSNGLDWTRFKGVKVSLKFWPKNVNFVTPENQPDGVQYPPVPEPGKSTWWGPVPWRPHWRLEYCFYGGHSYPPSNSGWCLGIPSPN